MTLYVAEDASIMGTVCMAVAFVHAELAEHWPMCKVCMCVCAERRTAMNFTHLLPKAIYMQLYFSGYNLYVMYPLTHALPSVSQC